MARWAHIVGQIPALKRYVPNIPAPMGWGIKTTGAFIINGLHVIRSVMFDLDLHAHFYSLHVSI